MRIVTWNIEHGKNLDVVASEIERHPELHSPDIMLAQELSPDQANELAAMLGLNVVYGSAAIHCETKEAFGNAILSRFPLDEPEHLELPHTALVNGLARSAMIATARTDKGPLVVSSIHAETVYLDLFRRTRQYRTLAKRLAATDGPCIVGGDFNSASWRSRRAASQEMSAARLRQIAPLHQPTFKRFGLPFRLDHIFGRDVELINGGAVVGARASDHDPVWADVRLQAANEEMR